MMAVVTYFRGLTSGPGQRLFMRLASAYAAILFCESPIIGAAFALITLVVPNIGAAGLLAAVSALVFAKPLGFADGERAPYVYNSLLVGLSLGALYPLNARFIFIIVLSAPLTILVTQIFSGALWRFARLPILSLPFVVIAWSTRLTARSMALATPFLPPTWDLSFLNTWWQGFFTSLGWFFFLPHALVGLLLFCGIVWTSRYLALLALCGYGVGYAALHVLSGAAILAAPIGFNFMLTAMTLGGIFIVPGRGSFMLAMFGVMLSALFAVVLEWLLFPYQLPVFTMPFLLATLSVLAGLAHRPALVKPDLLLETPNLPEASYERARLTAARLGDVGSVPLCAPFLDEWQVYQGFSGRHTHLPPWQYALDFFMLAGAYSFRNDGLELKDYYCYGAMVVAPAHGWVESCRDDLRDNPPGEVDTINNWGNYILIRMTNGCYVLLAHLQQGSLTVATGAGIVLGQPLAACGNSGRSPQPHLHLQVQTQPALGSATLPFHLYNVITSDDAHASPQASQVYQLMARPREMMRVAPAVRDEHLAAALHLPVGRCLTYRFRAAATDTWTLRQLRVELSLLGQFRLTSDSGASIAFEEWPTLLAFYDRSGGDDIFLDGWLLALGLTPLSSAAHHWRDNAAGRTLPLSAGNRLLLALRPLGAILDSTFERAWDSEAQCWRQEGRHQLCILPGHHIHATTTALLSPFSGFCSIALQTDSQRWEAVLDATGLAVDHGVPAYPATNPTPVQKISAAR